MTSHEKKNSAGNRFGLILVICGVALFAAGVLLRNLVLLLYSAFTRGQAGFDPIWMGLAFLVIAPALVFMGVLGWLNNRQ
ncbi:hypothetical protein [Leptolinea tardivitalis]|uniref:Uncharacterized protein n=1 Tax=Leptolinea tardivitalis TaxID=229920 RepID=A0A0P6XFU8_9CHLR|nr:hypothetical protein [Leptolinea tardivitalis]KPL73701.1 hypothetical protein ADM99_02435 [Leptolinea tardivitalis]GAP22829.1 hypothetical protein LTAR_03071 [Leptolinea tardivitalis]